MIKYFHGTRFQNHALVQDGTLVFCPPTWRLAANGDTSVPPPWGDSQSVVLPRAKESADIWATLPNDLRACQSLCGLARCCDRTFGSVALEEWRPSTADIARGMMAQPPCFACDEDVTLMRSGARYLRDRGMVPAVVLFDAETYPCWYQCFRSRGVPKPTPTCEDYSDIWDIVHAATGCTTDRFDAMGQTALYNAACAVVNALGFSGAIVLVNDIHLPGQPGHYYDADTMPTVPAISPRYCQIDPSSGPASVAAQLATAQARGASGVFILSDMLTTEAQLDALGPVLRASSPPAGV
jgi:hypothetical protein